MFIEHHDPIQETPEEIARAIETEARKTRRNLLSVGLSTRHLSKYVAEIKAHPAEELSVALIQELFACFRHAVLEAAIKYSPRKYRARWTRNRVCYAWFWLDCGCEYPRDGFAAAADSLDELLRLAGV